MPLTRIRSIHNFLQIHHLTHALDTPLAAMRDLGNHTVLLKQRGIPV